MGPLSVLLAYTVVLWVLCDGMVFPTTDNEGMTTQKQWVDLNCFSLGDNPQDCHFEGAFACVGAFPNHPLNGVVGQGGAGFCHKPNDQRYAQPQPSAIHGSLDKAVPNLDGSVSVAGWAVDRDSPGNGRTPLSVGIAIDDNIVYVVTANVSRPDLVKSGVAPDPNHGIQSTLPSSIAMKYGIAVGSHGNHTVTLHAWRWNDPDRNSRPVPFGSTKCIDNGQELEQCDGPPVPTPWYCCRQRVNTEPLTPAPPRVAKDYPLPPATRPGPGKANVVLFLTDDQDKHLGSLDAMNMTKKFFMNGGTYFTNYFVTTSVCCPSRTSLLSGRWAHNTGAVATTPAGWCALGKFYKGPMQKHALPTYISAAGVTTGIFGKETNANDETTISPGWDRFFVLGGNDEGHFYHNWFNDQGARWNATQDDYMTDLIQDRALKFINDSIAADKQFFAYIAPHAPHTRATPPNYAQSYFWDKKAPRSPSWNQSLPDHHWLVRSQPPLTDLCVSYSDNLYRNRLQSLIGVDSLVEAVVDTIFQAGKLDNTYFLYTSDHGFHLGEMSMPYFKIQPYDTDINVPFMIRGPGIKAGFQRTEIVLNVDIAPSIAGLFHTTPPPESLTDGHSIIPLLYPNESESQVHWRKDFLFEFWGAGKGAPGLYCHHIIASGNNTYQGVRTSDGLKYVDFNNAVYANGNGEAIEEAFNLTADPWEMVNLAKDPASQPWINSLRERLEVLRNCSQEECW